MNDVIVSQLGIFDKGFYSAVREEVMDRSVRQQQQHRLQALLRQLRQEAGLRQQDLAERLGEPQSFVSKYESGERRLDILELRGICRAMGISLLAIIRRLEDELEDDA